MRRLIIRPGAVGDCILSLPALEYLKAEYTEVWVPSPVVPLIQFADRVFSIASTGLDLFGIDGIEVTAQLPERLAGFDEVVSWYGTRRPAFRLALESVGPRCVFLPALPPDATMHAGDFFSVSAGALPGLLPRLAVPCCERRVTVVIHPFSGSAKKNWPLELYRMMAERLPLPVEWIAGPEEEFPGAIRFDSLLDLASWLAAADLYIGNDSGITHLAAAAGVPTLALFGPTNPAVWAPRGRQVEVLRHEPLNELPVQRVLDCANRLLGLR
jgi:heptosyltransferase-3